jgi:hypothetical protein
MKKTSSYSEQSSLLSALGAEYGQMKGRGLLVGFRGAFLGSILVAVIVVATPALRAVTIRPSVDGMVEDGFIFGPKDGIPDAVSGGSIVQILNTNRPGSPWEERGIIEFNISSLNTNTPLMLHLPVYGAMGPYPFTISVFTFAGDGALTLGDWNAGSLFTSFSYLGESSLDFDITSFIRDLQSSGNAFAGFNFRFTVPSTIPANGPFLAFSSLESENNGYGPPCTITDGNSPVPESGSTFLGMVCSILVLAAFGKLTRPS